MERWEERERQDRPNKTGWKNKHKVELILVLWCLSSGQEAKWVPPAPVHRSRRTRRSGKR